MTPRCFECRLFRKAGLAFKLEFIPLLQNEFSKQRHITLKAIILGLDRIYQNIQVCRTYFAEYIKGSKVDALYHANDAEHVKITKCKFKG